MYYVRTVCNVMQKQRIDLFNRIRVINRGYKQSSLLLPCISNKGCGNKFVGSNFEPVQNTNLSMNFSISAGVRSSVQGENQKKEKMKNYIVFGGLMGASLTVIVAYMVLSNIQHDQVYVKASIQNK